MKFWTVAGNSLVSKRGSLAQVPDIQGKPKMQTMLSVAFGQVLKSKLLIFMLLIVGVTELDLLTNV